MLEVICDKLGWQGGTIHQVKDEIIVQINECYWVDCDCYGHGLTRALEIMRAFGVNGTTDEGRALTREIISESEYGKDAQIGGTVANMVMEI